MGRKGRLTASFLIACKLKYTYSSINIIIKNRRLAPSIFLLKFSFVHAIKAYGRITSFNNRFTNSSCIVINMFFQFFIKSFPISFFSCLHHNFICSGARGYSIPFFINAKSIFMLLYEFIIQFTKMLKRLFIVSICPFFKSGHHVIIRAIKTSNPIRKSVALHSKTLSDFRDFLVFCCIYYTAFSMKCQVNCE